MLLVASSLLFLIPTALAMSLQLVLFATPLVVLSATSVLHHAFLGKHPRWKWLDRGVATGLTVGLTVSAFAFGRGRYSLLAGAMGLLAIALYVASKSRWEHAIFLHVALHITGAVGFAMYALALHHREFVWQRHA